ncbi:disulfide bond formation protein DsbB [Idiomarina sp. OT37-5b]|jgi:disulfide bond formation protein DsbB|uniref:Disulfide bond formation protein B n=1 Tax=Idiomarina aquatica TaxID=1327752 RepID=A0AA94EDN4_9GAMM|nr:MULTISPECIES: disulfide bond formation protein DsbB [Idiomarina]AVJ56423.1 disulfide bond formation protein DsbB [Idiomarina sp. OT37-5b]RUO39956.1 disulfide bond formation protein DsbB [Idiomarina aquatica]
MTPLAQWPARQTPWLLLFLGTMLLFVIALYFQHGMGLEPCVKCVYQRAAVLGIALAALVGGLGYKFWLTRWLGLLGWGYAAFEGLRIAYDHWDLQTSKNAFFAVCESAPNFPAWLPLHEWIPGFFAAPGLCGDIDWAFLGMGMPGWMTFIFAGLLSLAVIVALLHLIRGRQ